ncbi:MAG: deoxyguanosinetriphosphate triphosphohydrolase [Sedimentisphaerales bacterium]|nr:deoxyguanosinetriphosphate triphosphohydrolase [Sedimentisphaerales bacterium]
MSEKPVLYAVTSSQSKGRVYPQPQHSYRTEFERDRDRIIHCSAFRRLEGKTQVFTPGWNENYRTRLTHSIEVAQIGRTIAKALDLNESLTEAICLGHDLGHSPFGHAGEKVLNELMSDFGGFEHNRQSLRIVDWLEHPYPDFPGLNLMYETRLGFARHYSPYDQPERDNFKERQCTLEGQVANVADRIAYNCHDLEDGLRGRLLNEEKLREIRLCVEAQKRIEADRLTDRIVRQTRTAKTIIDMLVSDAIQTSRNAIVKSGVQSVREVVMRKEPLVQLDKSSEKKLCELEAFLLERMYHHPSIIEVTDKVEKWMKSVFDKLCKSPDQMPRYFQSMIESQGLQRVVCDYMAGMTDRFCLSLVEERL